MTSNEDPRTYVVRALESRGVICPAGYLEMLLKTPENKAIANLTPWAFLPVPERSIEYCSEAFGGPVLPFAQAIGQDLMACFLVDPSDNLSVVVINPWSESKASIVKAELCDFDAWLSYAGRISREYLEREQEEDDE